MLLAQARPRQPSPALLTLIHRSAWKKRNSRKFAVASTPSSAAASTRQRHGGPPRASKRGDYVPSVAPSCIKRLRLATVQLPEKSSLIGPGLDRISARFFRAPTRPPGRG